jgi:hypothetical protein
MIFHFQFANYSTDWVNAPHTVRYSKFAVIWFMFTPFDTWRSAT